MGLVCLAGLLALAGLVELVGLLGLTGLVGLPEVVVLVGFGGVGGPFNRLEVTKCLSQHSITNCLSYISGSMS